MMGRDIDANNDCDDNNDNSGTMITIRVCFLELKTKLTKKIKMNIKQFQN